MTRLFRLWAAVCLIAAMAALPSTSRPAAGDDRMPATNKYFSAGPLAALEIAIRANDSRAIAQALASGADVNGRGKFEITPLMIAVDVQCPDAVMSLLTAGALPNALAADRNGPVSLAVQSYRANRSGRDIMMAIFRAGGDPNARRPDGDPVI